MFPVVELGTSTSHLGGADTAQQNLCFFEQRRTDQLLVEGLTHFFCKCVDSLEFTPCAAPTKFDDQADESTGSYVAPSL